MTRLLLAGGGVLALGACATSDIPPMQNAVTPMAVFGDGFQNDESVMRAAGQALLAGDARAALSGFGDATARNPVDSARQTLLALAHQMSANGNPEALDTAAAGYDIAMRNPGDPFWAAALAGRMAFERGQYEQAQSYFARAVLSRPDDARALWALSISAYRAGDVQLSAFTADRAAELSLDPELTRNALRLVSLSRAALGQAPEAEAAFGRFAAMAPAEGPAVLTRVNHLVRTSAQNAFVEPAGPPAVAAAPDQVSVDVAIVLSQTTQRDALGVNLLDGLRLQYGGQAITTLTDTEGTRTGPSTRTITDAITLPQLTYNLNLFNRFGQYYQVVARPMLTAYRAETSEFFVGRTTKVAVSGVNSSQLEDINIGTSVKVTPIEITSELTRLRIEVSRSFLSSDPVGSFSETLNTFRQSVIATVEVRFGETLILSGLSESVMDATSSRVPLLGDAPIVGSLFNARNTNNRRDAVLILVTPAPVQTFGARPWARPADVEQLLQLWTTVVAPGSDLSAIAPHLGHARLFRRPRAEDGSLTWPRLPTDQGEILRDLLLP